MAAQARPGASGRAGTGPLTPGRARAQAGPKDRAAGKAGGPRAALPSIPQKVNALVPFYISTLLKEDHFIIDYINNWSKLDFFTVDVFATKISQTIHICITLGRIRYKDT